MTYHGCMTELSQGGGVVAQDGMAAQDGTEAQQDAVSGSDGLAGGAGVQGAVAVAEAWLAKLDDQLSVSASDVQDHLLDLWGALEEGPARSEVERWLTETLRRNLYSVSDINERLEGFLAVG